MKIKVCGITDPVQMQQLQDMGADYGGLIFYPPSKRFVGNLNESTKSAFSELSLKKVGVFVNQTYETIVNAIREYNLFAVQLHGDETDEFCLELMDKASVIKVFRMSEQQDIDSLVKPFEEVCHYYLFDTDTAGYGGSGKQFNWRVLENSHINKPFFLSGGIGPQDLEKVKSFQHPFLHAVDINSRFEVEPGIKDIKEVEAFVKAFQYG